MEEGNHGLAATGNAVHLSAGLVGRFGLRRRIAARRTNALHDDATTLTWVNFDGRENESGVEPKYTIGSYEALYHIVMEPEELENLGARNRRHRND